MKRIKNFNFNNLKENSCMTFVDILLLIGVVYLFSMCSNGTRTTHINDSKTHAGYDINYYVDTIYGHVVLSTVCSNDAGQISISTLEIDNFNNIDND